MAINDDELDSEFDEYDEYDDDEDEDEDEGGLSGFVVLLMGVVMLGAFASVVFIAYNQGIKNNENETPFVAADPEPVKIETAEEVASGNSREVYDSFEGGETNPVEVLAEGPEEPVARDIDNTIGAIAAAVENAGDAAAEITDDAVADRIAALEEADAALNETAENISDAATEVIDTVSTTITDAADAVEEVVDERPSEPVAPISPVAETRSVTDLIVETSGDTSALSGSHLVQVGAFRSDAEAGTYWTRMEANLGDYLGGKSKHVERADLGDKGVYHRLRIGPFASRDAASTYCAGLKERGQDCLIKAK